MRAALLKLVGAGAAEALREVAEEEYHQDVSIFCEWLLILALLLSGLLPNESYHNFLAGEGHLYLFPELCSIEYELPRQAKLSVCTTVERSVICLHPRLLLIKLQKQVGSGFVVRSACFGVTSSDVE